MVYYCSFISERGEVDGKLRIATHAVLPKHAVCGICAYVHNPDSRECAEDFTDYA